MNPAVAYVGDYTYSLDDLASNAKKRYLIAVQSGKPVLDSELSELGYRNLDFMRRYLERNVSDAVIDGDRTAVSEIDLIPGRTWRVEESTISNVNNFVVKGGTQEKPAVLIVKGYPILLFSDVEYNQQNNLGSLEDDDFTNSSIPSLSPPSAGTRTDTVYVDFYLAEVSSELGSEYQDTTIKNTNLNLQTSNRFRFVQDILVAAGSTSIPADGLDSNNVYHRYYKLAEMTRTAGNNAIINANIVDKRTYVNSLENLSNGKGELNVFNAFVQNDLTVHGTMTIINQTETNQEKLVITCNDPDVDSLAINKTQSGRALVVNKQDSGYAIDLTASGSDDAVNINKTGSGYAINVQNGSVLLDNDTDLFYSPAIEGVNSLKTHILNQLLLAEPTGFPNKTDSVFSFSNVTRQFTIAPTGPNFSFYINNTKYTRSSPESVIITDTEGVWFIYYDHSGILTASQTPWDVVQHVLIAYLYWDSTNDQAIILAEERHGTIMDGKTHEYLHRTIGTRYYTGLALTGNTVGTGNADADAQIAMTNGIIYDEDNVINIIDGVTSDFFVQELSPIANLPIFYRTGISGFWRKKIATAYPIYDDTSGTIFYNSSGASWGLTKAVDTYFVPMFIFATNDVNDPVIAILGQSQHSTFLDAQNNSSYQALAFGSIPFQEMKVLFRLIFQTSNSYTNATRAKLVDIQDLRSITNVPSATYVPTDHGSLSGLTDQNHPATAIFTNFNNFNGMLTAADTDVQKALDTLDDVWTRTGTGSSNTVDIYRTGDVIIGTNTASTDAKLLVADTLGNNHKTRIQALGTPTAINQIGGQILLAIDTKDTIIKAIVETNIGSETWAAAPRVGIQVSTYGPSGLIDALRITHDGRFGFGSTTVTAGFRAQVEGALLVTGNERVDGTATFNGNVNLSTQIADRIALIDASKNIVSSTVTLAELQVLDDFVENVQDIVGGMVSSNTENGIAITYDDVTGKLNFDVNDPVITIAGGASGSGTLTNLGNLTITITLNTEDVQDIVGGMVSSNTESGIAVTYDDASGKLNFDVNDPTITLSGDVSGSAVMTNLSNTTINVTLNNESVQDIVGSLITNGVKSGIAVTYDDANNRINFDVNDFTQLGDHVFSTDTGLRIQINGSSNEGGKLNFGDGDYVYLHEYDDDDLEIHASSVKITSSLKVTGVITGSLNGNASSADYATNADYAGSAGSADYATLTGYLGDHVESTTSGLRVRRFHTNSFGGKISFGDGDNVYIYEDTEDHLDIYASNGVYCNDLTGRFHANILSFMNNFEFRDFSTGGGTIAGLWLRYPDVADFLECRSDGAMSIRAPGGLTMWPSTNFRNSVNVQHAESFGYRTDGPYSVSTFATSGVYIYKCVLLNVGTTSKRSVFLVNTSETGKLILGIIGGNVGQVIHIINTNPNTILFLQSSVVGAYFREIAIHGGHSVQLIKIGNDASSINVRGFPSVNFHPTLGQYDGGFYQLHTYQDYNTWAVLSTTFVSSSPNSDKLVDLYSLPSS